MILAILGNIVINVGMNCMKHAHNLIQNPEVSSQRHFLRMPWWWAGILFIVFGELANLTAYGYAPAAIVTPMGSVGVVTNVFITTFLLKEPLTKQILIGAACVILGSVVVVGYAPLAVVFITPNTIWEEVLHTWHFLAYLLWMFVMIAILYPASLRYGKKYVLIPVGICAVIASLNVVTAKIFSTLVKNTIEFGWEYGGFLGPWPYVVLFVMITSCVLAMGYVNKAMMTFGNSQVVPLFFALFTISGVGSAAWIFYEFWCFTNLKQGMLFFVGIIIAISGVFLVSNGACFVLSDRTVEETERCTRCCELDGTGRCTRCGVLDVLVQIETVEPRVVFEVDVLLVEMQYRDVGNLEEQVRRTVQDQGPHSTETHTEGRKLPFTNEQNVQQVEFDDTIDQVPRIHSVREWVALVESSDSSVRGHLPGYRLRTDSSHTFQC